MHRLVLYSIRRESFVVNNFADSLDVQIKKTPRFCPVVGGISLQQHLLFNLKLCSLNEGEVCWEIPSVFYVQTDTVQMSLINSAFYTTRQLSPVFLTDFDECILAGLSLGVVDLSLPLLDNGVLLPLSEPDSACSCFRTFFLSWKSHQANTHYDNQDLHVSNFKHNTCSV